MMIACYFHEEVACIIRNAVGIGCLMLHLFVLLVPKLSGDDDDDDDEPLVLPSRSSIITAQGNYYGHRSSVRQCYGHQVEQYGLYFGVIPFILLQIGAQTFFDC